MKQGPARSSVHRSVLCVALKVFRSYLSPLRFVAFVALVAFVSIVIDDYSSRFARLSYTERATIKAHPTAPDRPAPTGIDGLFVAHQLNGTICPAVTKQCS
jgi:hypothetical protein